MDERESLDAAGGFVTETFPCDGGRQVTAYVPPNPPEAVVFAGDGQLISQWGRDLDTAATMIVGVHRSADETLRLRAARTAVSGVSASGEPAPATGLRHPDSYGAVLCASPGAVPADGGLGVRMTGRGHR